MPIFERTKTTCSYLAFFVCIVDVRNGFFDWFSVSAFGAYDICADYDRLKPAEAPI